MSQEKTEEQIKLVTNVDQDWDKATAEINVLLKEGWVRGEFKFNNAIMVQVMIKYNEEIN